DRERHRLQVVRVDAAPVAAEMVDGQAEADGGTQDFIRHPVGESPMALDVLDAVAITINGTDPQPADSIGLGNKPLAELIHPCALIPPRMSGAIPQGCLHWVSSANYDRDGGLPSRDPEMPWRYGGGLSRPFIPVHYV